MKPRILKASPFAIALALASCASSVPGVQVTGAVPMPARAEGSLPIGTSGSPTYIRFSDHIEISCDEATKLRQLDHTHVVAR